MSNRDEALKYLTKHERAVLRLWWDFADGDYEWDEVAALMVDVADALTADRKVDRLANPEE
jgi:hypothetical protein